MDHGLLTLSVDRINSIDRFSMALLKEFSRFVFRTRNYFNNNIFIFSQMFASADVIFSKKVCLKICAMEKIMISFFNTTTADTPRIYWVLTVISKFMFL